MYAAKEVLGEKLMSRILKDLISKHRNPNQKAVTKDLIEELIKAAPANQKSFIDESFNQVVDYQMELNVLQCKKLANGKFSVDLQVKVGKNKLGVDQLLAPDMDIDLAFFTQPILGLDRNSQPIYLQKHHFNRLVTKLTLVVDQKPKTIALDPYGYLLDANLKDNMQELK